MRRGKFCGVFSFAAGIFPCPQKAREKPSAPGSQFVFFLRRRLFKLGRGYNTEASSSELTLSEIRMPTWSSKPTWVFVQYADRESEILRSN
jgi:hypothetical protein